MTQADPAMQFETFLTIVVCVGFFGVGLCTLLAAAFLRVTIALYNTVVGGELSPSGVPDPSFLKAMGIIFTTWLVQGVVSFLLGMAARAGVEAGGGNVTEIPLVPLLISFAVSLVIMAGMLSSLLPTTLGRAIVVTLCYTFLLVLIIVAPIVAMLFVYGLGGLPQ